VSKFLNLLPGVILAVGIVVFYKYTNPYEPNPDIIAIFSGIIGGMFGGLIDRKQIQQGKSLKWSHILAIIGLIMGFVVSIFWLAIINYR
jgi:H+/Cl- antiporter ClcA